MNEQNNLKKRLHSDTVINAICTAGVGVTAIASFMTFLTRWDIYTQYGDVYRDPYVELKSAIGYALLFVVMLLLSLILCEIRKTGKPFSESNINRLRGMAVVLIGMSFIPELVKMIVRFIDSNATFETFRFGFENMFPIIMGVVVGIISEIFKYGLSLQEDSDSIA